MPIKGADPYSGLARDSFKARVRAAGAEHFFGRFQHAFAVANRVDPRFSNWLVRSFF